jgi:hypothetical protein
MSEDADAKYVYVCSVHMKAEVSSDRHECLLLTYVDTVCFLLKPGDTRMQDSSRGSMDATPCVGSGWGKTLANVFCHLKILAP